MEFLGQIFNTIFYQPLLSALLFIYQRLPGHDFGVAVIILTFLIKLVLYPLGAKAVKSQKALQGLQPKMKEIHERFKNDKNAQARETMELYKREKINPFSSFGLLLVQMPILFALFRVFGEGFKKIGVENPSFLGIVNLAEGSAVLAILSGLAQFWQTKMMAPAKASAGKSSRPEFSNLMNKQMLYFFPLFTVFILWRMPSAIALYWLATTLFTIFQQYITLEKSKDNAANKHWKN